MALDLLSIILGVVFGAAALAAVVALLRAQPEPDGPKMTTGWRISELRDPVIVAHDLEAEVPAEAKVLASGLVDPAVQHACDVRQVPPVRAEFALDLTARKGFLFLGGVRKGSMVLVVEGDLVDRLESEFRRMWDRAEPYVERYRIGELGRRTGATVQTEGYVQDVLPWKDAFMVRLEDQGHIVGVVVEKDPEALKEQRIRVTGRLEKDDAGYVMLRAHDVRRLG